MRVIGIESSCDETAVAVYDAAEGLLVSSALQPDRDAPGLRRSRARTRLPGPRSQAAAPGARGIGRRGLGSRLASTGWPIRRGRDSSARCWWARGLPGAWRTPGAGPRSASIISRGIFWRRCSSPSRPRFRSLPCWCPAVTPSWSMWPVSAGIESWERRWTMRPGRLSTRRRKCWGCPIPAAPRSRNWPRPAAVAASISRGRCSIGRDSILVSVA